MKAIVIDFKKSKKLGREVGKHSVVYQLYFFTIWFLDTTLLDALKRSHDLGIQEGRQIFKN